MALADSIAQVDAFIAGYQKARKKQSTTRIQLLIICPDCGKNPPFRNRCPKCGGDSWIPASPVNGIFEWVKARQWRNVVGAPSIAPSEPSAPEPQVQLSKDKRKARRQRRKR